MRRRMQRPRTFEVRPGGEFPLLRNGDQARYHYRDGRQFVTVYPRPGRVRAALGWLAAPATDTPRWIVGAFAVGAVSFLTVRVVEGHSLPIAVAAAVVLVVEVVIAVRRRRRRLAR